MKWNVFDKQEQWKLAYTAAARKRLMKWNVFVQQEQWELAYTATARKRLMKWNVFDKPSAEGKSRSVCAVPRRENDS